MADPRRLREILGFGYGAPSPAMSALEPFHAGVDPAYMPQDVVTASPGEGPSPYVRRGIEGLLGTVMPDRWASQWADKLSPIADLNPFQGAYDIGKGIGDAVQGGDGLDIAMSMIPGKVTEGATKVAKELDIPAAVKEAQARIRAYHGSPHDFDKFDLSKIGTGEGAQAYGHGLYFAESEGVAKSYRDALTSGTVYPTYKGQHIPSATALQTDPVASFSLHAVQSTDGNVDEAISALEDMGEQEAVAWLKANKDHFSAPNKGHMYEVNINADPDAFLDWDKPLSEQSEATRQAIAAAAANFEPRGPLAKGINQNLRSGNLDLTGEQAYTGIGGLSGGPEKIAASEVLKQAGIPGIKYLDAGSRGGDGTQGSRNYVVFSDEIIDIVKKYGIAGALGAGLITQQMADQLQAQQGGGQS